MDVEMFSFFVMTAGFLISIVSLITQIIINKTGKVTPKRKIACITVLIVALIFAIIGTTVFFYERNNKYEVLISPPNHLSVPEGSSVKYNLYLPEKFDGSLEELRDFLKLKATTNGFIADDLMEISDDRKTVYITFSQIINIPGSDSGDNSVNFISDTFDERRKVTFKEQGTTQFSIVPKKFVRVSYSNDYPKEAKEGGTLKYDIKLTPSESLVPIEDRGKMNLMLDFDEDYIVINRDRVNCKEVYGDFTTSKDDGTLKLEIKNILINTPVEAGDFLSENFRFRIVSINGIEINQDVILPGFTVL